MFSPELMRFLIKYQDKEFLVQEKQKEYRPKKSGGLLISELATIPIKSKH